MNKRILFVDDESKILEGIGRMLRGMRFDCDLSFATSGREALEILSREPYDIVVSDMRMPGMNGLELLNEVKSRYPNAIRIMLSGYAAPQLIMGSVGLVHQYLSKPCEAETLRSTVKRALELQRLMANEAIQRLVSRLSALPSLPSLYSDIVRELQSADPSIRRVGEIMAKDPGMTAKILQLVNSAFFGIRRAVSDPRDAAAYLGLETIQSLVLSLHAFRQFEVCRTSGFSIDRIWNHSMATGLLSKRIMERENQGKGLASEAFTAGLLHDLGKLVLATNLPQEYGRVLARAAGGAASLPEAELEAFGSTHAEIGAYLLGLWGLPNPIIEAVAWHHRPDESAEQGFGPLCAVHAADCLEWERTGGEPGGCQASRLNLPYLEAVGKASRLSAWRQWCGEN